MFFDPDANSIVFDIGSVEPIHSVNESFLRTFTAPPIDNEVHISDVELGFDTFESVNGSQHLPTFNLPIAALSDSEIALCITHGEFTLDDITSVLPIGRIAMISSLLESFNEF